MFQCVSNVNVRVRRLNLLSVPENRQQDEPQTHTAAGVCNNSDDAGVDAGDDAGDDALEREKGRSGRTRTRGESMT